MKKYQQENLEDIQRKEESSRVKLKEALALKFHHLRSTVSIGGVYNKKVLSGELQGKNPTIDGRKVDDFLKSTFKVKKG